jgi:hypothetical protein
MPVPHPGRKNVANAAPTSAPLYPHGAVGEDDLTETSQARIEEAERAMGESGSLVS